MTGVELIAAERQRQIEVEGWTPDHDDEHDDGQIAKAAAVYALPDEVRSTIVDGPFRLTAFLWPRSWHWGWFKPTPNDRVRELVKAGALCAAEIDRLQRTVPHVG